ncbi:Ferroporti-1 [Diplogelasinospora grovesii]|uniref:Solute carrier family 40 member n=1 Tax=Diplogelasinospora grovesii TaxID=303347 RepID=A0AAN6S7U9_9PEZI|nr:Ferroporti-1 [Diplogelasinospora grovesii]
MFVMLMNERAMSPESDLSREETPLLLSEHDHGHHDENGVVELKKSLLWRLYISHFLSTWNMRSYEFTVILLFAKAYPDTLLPTSIRGVLTNGATLLLSPAIGRWVDLHSRRFYTMRITILVQRLSIVFGCVLWIFLFLYLDTPHPHGRRQVMFVEEVVPRFKDVIVAVLMVFGIVERMCAVGNNLVMERDWVPTIASEVSSPPLHQLNAIMRRIDLISKILAPVFVSVLAIRLQNPGYLALITAVMNLGTVWVELISARSAWDKCNVLKLAREAKTTLEEEQYLPLRNSMDDERELVDHDHPLPTTTTTMVPPDRPGGEKKSGLWLYLSSDVCLASISSALQSFSVLSLSGPMTTYLLTRHYSLPLITAARTAISVIEIASTLIFPLAAGTTLLRRQAKADPMAVLGLSGVTFQLALLTPCFVALLLVPVPTDSTTTKDPASAFPLYTTLIFVFLGLSRLGHWTHNMAVQQIVQTRVPAAQRVEFSGVEMTFVSAAEIGRWGTAAIWSRPEQFKGVAAGGLVSVLVIWGLFTTWVVLSRHQQQKKRKEKRRGRE